MFPYPREDFWGANLEMRYRMEDEILFPSPLEDWGGSNRTKTRVYFAEVSSFHPLSRIGGVLTWC